MGSAPILSLIMLIMGEIKGEILALIRTFSLLVLTTQFIGTYALGRRLEVLSVGEVRLLSN